MADTSEESGKIVDTILRLERPRTSEDLYVEDLLLHAREFQTEYEIVLQAGGGFPCAVRDDGALVPMAFRVLNQRGFPFFPWRSTPQYFARGEDLGGGAVQFIEPEKARVLLREGMVGFLTSRIRSLSADVRARVNLKLPRLGGFGFGRALISVPGFLVEVSASPLLRVHVSPTFRRSWRFFASPTSPAKGTLPGGIYEFAVDGGPYPAITPDTGTFDIPYGTLTPGLAL
jgi:hypothetical protein